jgi:hypothetical protein
LPLATMNANDTHFDRLVDDELSEEQRRELLGRLDDEPGGWRRCALAFLESQCWKQALGRTPQELEEVRKPTVTKNPRRSPWTERLRLLSAMAASFLVALGLGSWARQAWIAHPGVSGTTSQFASSAGDVPRLPAPDQPETSLASAPSKTTVMPNPWHMVTVSAPSDGRPRPLIDMPAIVRDRFDEQWLRSLPPTIPDDVMRALVRTGHQVQQRRELVPVPLNDGRQLVVPVDHVDVHYIGNGPY